MISKKCKYAIRALIYIANNQAEMGLVDSSQIAEKERIPKKFLEAILHELRKNQILHSSRGKLGGYKLLKDPSEIKLTDIMRIMDGPIAMLPCVSLNYYAKCDECDETTCVIKPVFEKIRDLTLDVLNNTNVLKLKEESILKNKEHNDEIQK
ncbi:MAG TPA: Rrf2 family transcriptional regulator [Saprospiraceae bacterium]|nr:Rrf2 family transcriptional regulator [Saprospiraceae bacterium]